MRRAIQAYNRATNTPEALDRGYHETMTQAFMRLIFTAAEQAEVGVTSDQFCERHPELLSKAILRRHYSSERLMTLKAKGEFVPPDLLPLPTIRSNGPRITNH